MTSVIAESALMTTRGDAGLPAMILRPPDKPVPVVVEPVFVETLLTRLGICSRRRVGNCAAGEEKLYPVVELIVQVHFGDGDVDCDLQFWPVELNERPFDELVFIGPRIDEHRVVGYIGRDPDIGQLRPARSSLAQRVEFRVECRDWHPAELRGGGSRSCRLHLAKPGLLELGEAPPGELGEAPLAPPVRPANPPVSLSAAVIAFTPEPGAISFVGDSAETRRRWSRRSAATIGRFA